MLSSLGVYRRPCVSPINAPLLRQYVLHRLLQDFCPSLWRGCINTFRLFLYSPKSLPADAPTFFFVFICYYINRCFKTLLRQPLEGRNGKKAGEKKKLYVRGGDSKTGEIHINIERRYEKDTFYDRSTGSLSFSSLISSFLKNWKSATAYEYVRAAERCAVSLIHQR